MDSKREAIARILAQASRAGKKIKHIRPPRTDNKDNEEARRRRQMASGALNQESRGVVGLG